MNLSTPLPRDQVRSVRGERLLLGLHRCLPLGRHYRFLLSALNSRRGLLAVPLQSRHVLMPASWAKSATHLLLAGVDLIPEFRLLMPVLPRLSAGCVVDLGANIGLYTVLFRSASPLPIVAYEPQPFLSRLLQWNVDFNRFDRVTVRRVACGAVPGEVIMHAGKNGFVATEAEQAAVRETVGARDEQDESWERQARREELGDQWERVPVVTLDEELPQLGRVALLKIDCEGYELNILRGARRLLEQPGLHLFIELHPGPLKQFGQSVPEVIDLLSARYDLEFWTFEHGRPKSKLGRSLAKCRRPQVHRYASAAEVLAAVKSEGCPGQIYCLGRPRQP